MKELILVIKCKMNLAKKECSKEKKNVNKLVVGFEGDAQRMVSCGFIGAQWYKGNCTREAARVG